jgi:Uma2 family endonuclease
MAAIDAMKTSASRGIVATALKPKAVYYPTGDGKPLGEDESHVRETLNCIQSLRFWFRDRPDVYVCGNNFVYWNEGFPRDRVSPDTYVVFGVGKRVRPSYKSWDENGKLPDVVFEFTSKSTMRQDIDRKLALYGQVWKSREYFLFDPNREYLKPPLQGFRLAGGRYVPIEGAADRIYSEQLGLELVVIGEYLRFYDPAAGENIPSLAELAVQAESERRRAVEEGRKAAEERLRAEHERLRAEVLEAENARLQAEIAALRRGSGGGA